MCQSYHVEGFCFEGQTIRRGSKTRDCLHFQKFGCSSEFFPPATPRLSVHQVDADYLTCLLGASEAEEAFPGSNVQYFERGGMNLEAISSRSLPISENSNTSQETSLSVKSLESIWTVLVFLLVVSVNIGECRCLEAGLLLVDAFATTLEALGLPG